MMIRFGADEYQLKSTWASSLEFAEKIGDPLELAFRGIEGEKVFSSKTAVMAIWIGMKAGGYEKTYTEVGELCHQFGLVDCYKIANAYLVEMISHGKSEEAEVTEKKQLAGSQ